MSRPKPTILLQYTDPRTYRADQVLKSDAIYAVFYEGLPINLRSLTDTILVERGAKYRKVSFSNSGHAFNLAERLNKMFKTDEFKVMKLTKGMIVTEEDSE